jgi:hypothetical protein
VLGGHVQVAALAVQSDCAVSRKVMNEKVPRGKPDGRAEGVREEAGVGGLSVSEAAPAVGLAWLFAGPAPLVVVVEEGEMLYVVSDSTATLDCVR